MDEAPSHIVRLRIVDHQAEIDLEPKTILVLSLLQLRVHRTKVHRALDDLEVAKPGSVFISCAEDASIYFGARSRTGSTGCRNTAAFLCVCSFLRAARQARRSFSDMPPDCAFGTAFATFFSFCNATATFVGTFGTENSLPCLCDAVIGAAVLGVGAAEAST